MSTVTITIDKALGEKLLGCLILAQQALWNPDDRCAGQAAMSIIATVHPELRAALLSQAAKEDP